MVDELVGLPNNMDATFRAELRELNDQKFPRFEAKLEQRISGLGAELRTDMAALGAEITASGAGLRTEMVGVAAELITWMFLFWLGTLATMVGIGRLLLR